MMYLRTYFLIEAIPYKLTNGDWSKGGYCGGSRRPENYGYVSVVSSDPFDQHVDRFSTPEEAKAQLPCYAGPSRVVQLTVAYGVNKLNHTYEYGRGDGKDDPMSKGYETLPHSWRAEPIVG